MWSHPGGGMSLLLGTCVSTGLSRKWQWPIEVAGTDTDTPARPLPFLFGEDRKVVFVQSDFRVHELN